MNSDYVVIGKQKVKEVQKASYLYAKKKKDLLEYAMANPYKQISSNKEVFNKEQKELSINTANTIFFPFLSKEEREGLPPDFEIKRSTVKTVIKNYYPNLLVIAEKVRKHVKYMMKVRPGCSLDEFNMMFYNRCKKDYFDQIEKDQKEFQVMSHTKRHEYVALEAPTDKWDEDWDDILANSRKPLEE